MIVDIDFSLFSSPTKAYGRISGNFRIEFMINEGDELRILREVESDWFSGVLKVASIAYMHDDDKPLIGLQDVVAQNREDAMRLSRRFEKEAGLFCDQYE